MERPADMTGSALIVETSRDRNRVRIGFNHRVQCRIERLNAIQIAKHEIPARELAVCHGRLQLRNRRFYKWKTASAKRAVFKERGEAAA